MEHIHSIISSRMTTGRAKVASLLMLDVSGSFDNVSHERLIHNLKRCQIPTQVRDWIKDFLQHRKTVIKFPEYTSAEMDTPTGIPQGSPLSPILYLFCNADLLEELSKG